jgi:2-amino-4-hydroxy-6-hydroxymethyldihydropteridine diphosphokinase
MKGTVYLSLGSNVGDRATNLRDAINRLGSLGQVIAVSGFYETEPVEVESAQPWFLNCAVQLETSLSPRELLAQTLALEQVMGRRRTGARSPRIIDIDILYFDKLVISTSDLRIPHPGAAHRRFVLQPLAELAPDLRDPISKRTVGQMLESLSEDAAVVRKWTS